MIRFTLEQCISWVKTSMETKNDRYTTVYEWNMLLAILQHLERLEESEKENCVKDGMIKFFETEFKRLENVIEILKDKKVNIRLLFMQTLEVYNFLLDIEYNLTQQEYELLKEVFGNE